MARISVRGKKFYHMHGWNDKDIAYLQTHADEIEEGEQWVMGVKESEPGTFWLYPTSPGNKFPKSLWERIKHYIDTKPNVVIPMNENMDKVLSAAKRYNGFLVDNVYMFGKELEGLRGYSGPKLWAHSLGESETKLIGGQNV